MRQSGARPLADFARPLHAALCAIFRQMLSGDPAVGLRKPERLGHNLAGLWSRRLSQRGHLVYRFDDERIYIFAIGGHHDEK